MHKIMSAAMALAAVPAFTALSAQQPAQPATHGLQIAGVASPTEHRTVTRWINDVTELLRSAEFEANLRSLSQVYPTIWLSNYHGYKTPAQVVSIMKLQDANYPQSRYMPVAFSLTGGSAVEDRATTGWTGYEEAGKSTAYMNIGRVHYERYRSTNTVTRSCAINTLAHEIAHTISNHPTQYLMYMEDTGVGHPDHPGEPVGTYLIGSLAQCTYLQKAGRIGAADLKSCLATFGVYDFRNSHCSSFQNETDPVRPPRH